MKEAGFYVHYPFCTHKCPYCDFNTWPLDKMQEAGAREKTRKALEAEVSWLLRALESEPESPRLATLYLGGGTPSLAEPGEIAGLVTLVRNAGHSPREITLEANPESFDHTRFEEYLAAGVNRISTGVQSFSDEVLRFLGRGHNAARAREVLRWLSSNNELCSWNFDLIYGVGGGGPGAQTPESFAEELEELLSWEPPHVSLYALEIHGATEFGRRRSGGEILAAEDDLQADLFARARESLLAAGYRHYEIANFAKPGHEAVHNSFYWRRQPVLAAGPGAWGFWQGSGAQWGMRWQISRSFPAYLEWAGALEDEDSSTGLLRLAGSDLPSRPARVEIHTEEIALAESLFLGLRLLEEGVSLEEVRTRFGKRAVAQKLEALRKFLDAGWVSERGGRLYLSGQRALVANAVFSELLPQKGLSETGTVIPET